MTLTPNKSATCACWPAPSSRRVRATACRARMTKKSSTTSCAASSATATMSVARWAKIPAGVREPGGAPLTALVRVVLLCYYRDDRVMRSLGQEPRPPFPKGHVVEQGDWSLLDPVRKRPRMHRLGGGTRKPLIKICNGGNNGRPSHIHHAACRRHCRP